MRNTNILLKTILTIIFIVVAICMSNYYLFWLLLFYLLLITIVDKNLISLALEFFLALILLFIYFTFKMRVLSSAIVVVDILVLFITSFTKRDLWKLKYEAAYKNIHKRKRIFMDNFKRYVDDSNEEKLKKYNYEITDELISNKNKSDADDLYKYSKVRFYGYGTTMTSMFAKFSVYDIIYLLVSILVLVLIFIFW
jgi:hypothetical protein